MDPVIDPNNPQPLPDAQPLPTPDPAPADPTPPVDPAPAPETLPIEPRKPAAVLLHEFLEANNLDITLPPITTREVTDGSLIIDIPKNIIIKYKDE